jgi:hypothetical protein
MCGEVAQYRVIANVDESMLQTAQANNGNLRRSFAVVGY